MHLNFVAAEQQAVDLDPDYFGAPLVQTLNVRVSVPMYASLQVQALVERVEVSKVVRRWLRLGAKAEGIDIDRLI